MRYQTFILFVVCLLLTFASCASRRKRYMEAAENVQAINHTEKRTIDSQVHRSIIGSHLDSLEYHETVTITPLGCFTYHPDSGYRGRASLVQLRRQSIRTQRHILRDSTQQLHRTAVTVADSAAIRETRTVEQREQPGTPWRWMAIAVVLLLVVGFLARRLFR